MLDASGPASANCTVTDNVIRESFKPTPNM